MRTIKAKVHMLPTENEGVIISDVGPYDTDMIPTSEVPKELRSHDRPHNHLYFTTDEEIKEGDWFYNPATKGVLYASKEMLSWNCDTTQEHKGWKKIIASTDPKLLTELGRYKKMDAREVSTFKKGREIPSDYKLPQPSQAFIEAYCKAGGIDEVLVEVENYEILKARQLGVNSHLDAINSINSSIFPQPKLNPDNTIIIHPVEEKMYSREEVESYLKDFQSALHEEHDIPTQNMGFRLRWIEENL